MGNNLSSKDIVRQSHAAYDQWCVQWRKHAKEHKEMNIKTTFLDYCNKGIGKALLICGNGYSLEEEIDVIKEFKDNIDIMVCDKAMGHLFNHDIIPKYVVVCDANVSYDQYLKPWKDKLGKSHLFINSCANTEWTRSDWKEKCIFVNMDSIQTEIEMCELSGCNNLLPAATNVSNQMLVLATQCTNKGRNNWFGYDKIVLIGFDYSWREADNYYAFDATGEGKRFYMKHGYCLDRDFKSCYSSSNLIFSAKWLDDYIKNFMLPVVSGTKRTLLASTPTKTLESQLKYRYKPSDSITVLGLSDLRGSLMAQVNMIDNKLNTIGQDHLKQYRESI